jgi:K+-sensing histidine kinase KdpD
MSDDARDAVEAKIPTTPNEVTKFPDAREAAHVVVGVGTHSRWMSQLVEKFGHRVTIADPRRLKIIRASNGKTATAGRPAGPRRSSPARLRDTAE